MTQSELARRSGVSRSTISRLERGHLEALTLRTTRRIGRHLDLRVQLEGAWRGGDLQRVMNAGHSAMHEAMIAIFERIDGWEIASEVSFSIYGERGVIDMLAFNAQGRVVLVVELKTEIVDGQALVGTMDRRRRLALKIATERGWQAEVAALWVVVADTRSNRRRLALQARLLRHAFPTDGRRIRSWLRRPNGPVSALSFLSETHVLTDAHGRSGGRQFGLPKRIASRRPCARKPPASRIS
jgi:DNA-binding XRE family transcriptional regulator